MDRILNWGAIIILAIQVRMQPCAQLTERTPGNADMHAEQHCARGMRGNETCLRLPSAACKVGGRETGADGWMGTRAARPGNSCQTRLRPDLQVAPLGIPCRPHAATRAHASWVRSL
eukprot:350897-Chlamydomonas_euryale.AAC.4